MKAIVIYVYGLLALGIGFWWGYVGGRNKRLTPSEASKVLAKLRGRNRMAVAVKVSDGGVHVL